MEGNTAGLMWSHGVRRDESSSQGEEDDAQGGSAEEGSGANSEADSDTSEGSSLESMASEERECAPFWPTCTGQCSVARSHSLGLVRGTDPLLYCTMCVHAPGRTDPLLHCTRVCLQLALSLPVLWYRPTERFCTVNKA